MTALATFPARWTVTILREDVWNAASTKPYSLHTPGPLVVVANGKALDLLGRTTVSLKVAGMKVNRKLITHVW